ncbi:MULTISPECIES: hypothetical protein [unclassified Chryseobacterium]|uniref:hypothetical protein n=1 Tax=unclassified Chryseobacterium TaxID=2593645 RepID=UPI0009544F8C|nr:MULTISPECIES: hypothetical protein [unclassified Chryseobacterium]SIR55897.1 hypothetical protein SAMN05880573_12713 [Chryseobacterium sp. RU33C]
MRFTYILVIFLYQFTFSQVGINIQSPKATLDILPSSHGSKAEGIIVPRLTGDQIKSGDIEHDIPQKGCIVYATSPVTSASAKTANITAVGLYYFDGSIWQRIDNSVSNIYNFDGILSSDRVVDITTNNLTFTGNGKVGIGNSSPITKIDVRSLPGDSSPGEGSIGIGQTSFSSSDAGAGSLRYVTSSGGELQYSNGTDWNSIESDIQKSVVIANLPSNSFTFINFAFASPVFNWTESIDTNNNFDPTTGVFTVPRTGNYLVNVSLVPSAIASNNNFFETQIRKNGVKITATIEHASQVTAAYYYGGNISAVVNAIAGDKIQTTYFHTLGQNIISDLSKFNSLSISEL